ncbi:hypothetical protein N2152v2_003913 [Parachlorella kessleri]
MAGELPGLLQSATEGVLQERIARQLQKSLACRPVAGPTKTQVTPSYLLQSPVYRPLSPAPADLEIQQLEEEVTAAAQRAAAVRQAAPAKLREIYTAKLAQLRPVTDALQPCAAASVAEAAPHADSKQEQGQENVAQERDAPLTYSPDPQQLKQKLAGASTKLPVLRARLESASDRVQRVFAVLSTELNRPPPNTVERVLLGGKTPGRPAAAAASGTLGTSSPAGEQAAEARVRDDLQPVPMTLPEEPST